MNPIEQSQENPLIDLSTVTPSTWTAQPVTFDNTAQAEQDARVQSLIGSNTLEQEQNRLLGNLIQESDAALQDEILLRSQVPTLYSEDPTQPSDWDKSYEQYFNDAWNVLKTTEASQQVTEDPNVLSSIYFFDSERVRNLYSGTRGEPAYDGIDGNEFSFGRSFGEFGTGVAGGLLWLVGGAGSSIANAVADVAGAAGTLGAAAGSLADPLFGKPIGTSATEYMENYWGKAKTPFLYQQFFMGRDVYNPFYTDVRSDFYDPGDTPRYQAHPVSRGLDWIFGVDDKEKFAQQELTEATLRAYLGAITTNAVEGIVAPFGLPTAFKGRAAEVQVPLWEALRIAQAKNEPEQGIDSFRRAARFAVGTAIAFMTPDPLDFIGGSKAARTQVNTASLEAEQSRVGGLLARYQTTPEKIAEKWAETSLKKTQGLSNEAILSYDLFSGLNRGEREIASRLFGSDQQFTNLVVSKLTKQTEPAFIQPPKFQTVRLELGDPVVASRFPDPLVLRSAGIEDVLQNWKVTQLDESSALYTRPSEIAQLMEPITSDDFYKVWADTSTRSESSALYNERVASSPSFAEVPFEDFHFSNAYHSYIGQQEAERISLMNAVATSSPGLEAGLNYVAKFRANTDVRLIPDSISPSTLKQEIDRVLLEKPDNIFTEELPEPQFLAEKLYTNALLNPNKYSELPNFDEIFKIVGREYVYKVQDPSLDLATRISNKVSTYLYGRLKPYYSEGLSSRLLPPAKYEDLKALENEAAEKYYSLMPTNDLELVRYPSFRDYLPTYINQRDFNSFYREATAWVPNPPRREQLRNELYNALLKGNVGVSSEEGLQANQLLQRVADSLIAKESNLPTLITAVVDTTKPRNPSTGFRVPSRPPSYPASAFNSSVDRVAVRIPGRVSYTTRDGIALNPVLEEMLDRPATFSTIPTADPFNVAPVLRSQLGLVPFVIEKPGALVLAEPIKPQADVSRYLSSAVTEGSVPLKDIDQLDSSFFVALSQGLRDLHSRGFGFESITPDNVFINPQTGRWEIDAPLVSLSDQNVQQINQLGAYNLIADSVGVAQANQLFLPEYKGLSYLPTQFSNWMVANLSQGNIVLSPDRTQFTAITETAKEQLDSIAVKVEELSPIALDEIPRFLEAAWNIPGSATISSELLTPEALKKVATNNKPRTAKNIVELASLIPHPTKPGQPLLRPTQEIAQAFFERYGRPHPYYVHATKKLPPKAATTRAHLSIKALADSFKDNEFYHSIVDLDRPQIPEDFIRRVEQNLVDNYDQYIILNYQGDIYHVLPTDLTPEQPRLFPDFTYDGLPIEVRNAAVFHAISEYTKNYPEIGQLPGAFDLWVSLSPLIDEMDNTQLSQFARNLAVIADTGQRGVSMAYSYTAEAQQLLSVVESMNPAERMSLIRAVFSEASRRMPIEDPSLGVAALENLSVAARNLPETEKFPAIFSTAEELIPNKLTQKPANTVLTPEEVEDAELAATVDEVGSLAEAAATIRDTLAATQDVYQRIADKVTRARTGRLKLEQIQSSLGGLQNTLERMLQSTDIEYLGTVAPLAKVYLEELNGIREGLANSKQWYKEATKERVLAQIDSIREALNELGSTSVKNLDVENRVDVESVGAELIKPKKGRKKKPQENNINFAVANELAKQSGSPELSELTNSLSDLQKATEENVVPSDLYTSSREALDQVSQLMESSSQVLSDLVNSPETNQLLDKFNDSIDDLGRANSEKAIEATRDFDAEIDRFEDNFEGDLC